MPPKLYTLAETAAIFRVSKRVFAGFIADKPFYRTIGRAKLFTDRDIAQLYEVMGSPSKSSNAATRSAADRPEASEYARVAALMSRALPKKSKRSSR
jgi:hypothetical protein